MLHRAHAGIRIPRLSATAAYCVQQQQRRAFVPSIAEPPLPSALAPDRDGAISFAEDKFSSRKLQGKFGAYRGRDIVPLWIADMDFQCPEPVLDAVTACAQRGIFGYTNPPPKLTPLALARLAETYGCSAAQADWVGWIPGLIGGLSYAVRVASSRAGPPGTAVNVAVLTPAYPPFLGMPGHNLATLDAIPLLKEPAEERSEGAAAGAAASAGVVRFEIDWSALEASLSAATTKLLLLCNPHNPTGRCWSKADLTKLTSLCVAHDVLICSDEVWGEMPLEADETPFTSTLALLDDVAGLRERLLVITSPSKCYNVATLDIALTVVPDAALRGEYKRAGADAAEVTPFGYFAAEACYGAPESEAWRQRLLAYLRANRDYAVERLTTALPHGAVKVTRPESSYLLWVDATQLLAGSKAEAGGAAAHLLSYGVGASAGEDFGASNTTFRINLACERSTLERGLGRIVEALSAPDTPGDK